MASVAESKRSYIRQLLEGTADAVVEQQSCVKPSSVQGRWKRLNLILIDLVIEECQRRAPAAMLKWE